MAVTPQSGNVEMAKMPTTYVSAAEPEVTKETLLDPEEWAALDPVAKQGFTIADQRDMQRMGKKQQFRRNFKFVTTVGFTCCVVSMHRPDA